MRRPRLTISSAMTLIGLLTIWLAALRSGSQGWFQATYALTLVSLLAATLAARLRPSQAGSFWFGFALFGWCYLLLGASNLGVITFGYGLAQSGAPSDLLPVTDWLRAALDRLMDFDVVWADEPMKIGGGYVTERYNRVLWIAQFLVTLIVATLGGFIACRFETYSENSDDERGHRDC